MPKTLKYGTPLGAPQTMVLNTIALTGVPKTLKYGTPLGAPQTMVLNTIALTGVPKTHKYGTPLGAQIFDTSYFFIERAISEMQVLIKSPLQFGDARYWFSLCATKQIKEFRGWPKNVHLMSNNTISVLLQRSHPYNVYSRFPE